MSESSTRSQTGTETGARIVIAIEPIDYSSGQRDTLAELVYKIAKRAYEQDQRAAAAAIAGSANDESLTENEVKASTKNTKSRPVVGVDISSPKKRKTRVAPKKAKQ